MGDYLGKSKISKIQIKSHPSALLFHPLPLMKTKSTARNWISDPVPFEVSDRIPINFYKSRLTFFLICSVYFTVECIYCLISTPSLLSKSIEMLCAVTQQSGLGSFKLC